MLRSIIHFLLVNRNNFVTEVSNAIFLKSGSRGLQNLLAVR